MSRQLRVFISSTSADLASYRKLVAEHLYSIDALPVVQDLSGTETGPLLEILKKKIKSCDVVICLVGVCYGREPHPETQKGVRRSYTQREYDLAKAMGKQVFVFVAGANCEFDSVCTEGEELAELQRRYIASFREDGLLTHKFSNKTDLERLLGKLKLVRRRGLLGPVAALVLAAGALGAVLLPPKSGEGKVTPVVPGTVPEKPAPEGDLVNEAGMSFVPVPGMPGLLAARHETTWGQWEAWGGGDSVMKGGASAECPVAGVRLAQINQFCTWLTDQSLKSGLIPPGARYRLPTVQEWNALAGLTAANAQVPLYPWGDSAPQAARLASAVANFAASETSVGNRLLPADGYSEVSPVGCFPANGAGLFDVSGNVAELCVTRGLPVYVRGGSWADNDENAFDLRFARDMDESDVEKDKTVGFRVLLELPDAGK